MLQFTALDASGKDVAGRYGFAHYTLERKS